MNSPLLIQSCALIATLLFIGGLRAMSSPKSAWAGIRWAGLGMILAIAATLLTPGMRNQGWICAALAIGAAVAWVSAKKVAMTDTPQMVALFNGLGGGAAAAIAAAEWARDGFGHTPVASFLAVAGALIGGVSFSGSLIAFAKLQGLMQKTSRLPGQNVINIVLSVVAVALLAGLEIKPAANGVFTSVFFAVAVALGVILTLPIGGADMPVVISLFNALTGLAVAAEGYVLGSPLLTVAGVVVGAAGALLTQLMAKAMNRSLTNILFAPITGESSAAGSAGGVAKEVSATDVAAMMRYAQKVIVIPGYGMAVGHAQHKVWEMARLLQEEGVEVKFAIHPVAGRMPGHMNVLLAEAGVPYESILDLDEINSEFPQTDVALVIGANDVVNPSARTEKASPIYGMPILNADQARNVIVVKRGKGAGYSGIDNPLFYRDQTRMLYGNAQQAINDVIQGIKALK